MYREIRKQRNELAPLLEEAELFGVENIGRWNRAHRMLNRKEIAELREAVEKKRPIEDLDAAGEETTKPLLDYKPLCLPEWVPKAMYGELLRIYDFMHTFHAILHDPDDYNGDEEDDEGEKPDDDADVEHISFSELVKAVCASPICPPKELDLTKFDPIPSLTRLLKKLIKAKFRTFGQKERVAAWIGRERDVEEGRMKFSKFSIVHEYRRVTSIHGVRLEELPIEPATLTEILLITMKTAGYCPKTNSYQLADKDVLAVFFRRDSVLVAMLESWTVYELSAEQRLALVRTFVDQLSLYVAFRERCEEKRAHEEKKGEEVCNRRPPRVMKPLKRNSKAATPSAMDDRQEHFPWKTGDEQDGQKGRGEEVASIDVSSTSDSSVVLLEEPLFYIGEDRYFRHYYCFKTDEDGEGGLLLLIEDVVTDTKALEIAALYEHYSDELSGRFSIYCAKEGIQPLLDTLCRHGVREFQLAKRLSHYKPTLDHGMKLMHEAFADQLSFIVEAWDSSNSGSAVRDGISPTETMKRGFIAFLLDLEEKIFIGHFGSLSCDCDRTAWRAALKHAGNTLDFSSGAIPLQGSKKAPNEVLVSIDALKGLEDVTGARKLAVALLQIAQGLKWDCLQEPLVMKNNNAGVAGYVAWQKEVAHAGSISSLVLLTKPLMKSINWDWVDLSRYRGPAAIPYRGVVQYLVPNNTRMTRRQQEKATRDALSTPIPPVSAATLNHVETSQWRAFAHFLVQSRLDSIPTRVRTRRAAFKRELPSDDDEDEQSSGGSSEDEEEAPQPAKKVKKTQPAPAATRTTATRKYTLRSTERAQTQQQ